MIILIRPKGYVIISSQGHLKFKNNLITSIGQQRLTNSNSHPLVMGMRIIQPFRDEEWNVLISMKFTKLTFIFVVVVLMIVVVILRLFLTLIDNICHILSVNIQSSFSILHHILW